MPLLVHATFWWITGLLAGAHAAGSAGVPRLPALDGRAWLTALLGAVLAFGGVSVLLGAGGSWRRRGSAPLLAVPLAFAGWVAASAARVELQRCRSAVQVAARRDSSALVRVEQVLRAAPGPRRSTTLRGLAWWQSPQGHSCAVPVLARLARGTSDTIAAGATHRISGRVLATASGLRLDNARLEPIVAPGAIPSSGWWSAFVATAEGALLRWRAHLGRVIDSHFRARAPLVRALLIADQHGIAPEIRERYADAGLVHMLSVSGMHVAIIASALLTLGGLLRLPRRPFELVALAIVVGYVALLGCPPPAVRSAVMLAVVTLAKRWQRPVHDWTALALGAVVPTMNPLVVVDLGWQLSVAGMAALVAARSLLRRWRQSRPAAHRGPVGRWWYRLGARRGVTGWFVSEITTGLLATVLTAPIIAWTFGRLSLVAPASNILAGPLVALLQPALFAALLWALLLPPSAATLLPDATQPLMALFDRVATLCASVPGGVLPVSLTLGTALALGIAAACFLRATAARRLTPWMLPATLAAVVALWVPVMQRGSGMFELHVLDVGQGDALAVRTPRGRWILVDAGRRWDGGDAGRRTVVPHVRRRGGDVALFVLSHPHDDHAGGAASLVQALGPALWWEPAFVSTSPGYREALRAVQTTRTRWERVHPGRQFVLDEVAVTVLAPDSAWTMQQRDANETSVVLRIDYGAHRFLLTGDAERHEEAWMLARYGAAELEADVLKLGHHGSRTSSTPALLDAVAPRLAIASVGAGNRYGHPAPETLAALLARGTTVLRTDLEGTIVLRSDGRHLTAEAGGDRWEIPSRRPLE